MTKRGSAWVLAAGLLLVALFAATMLLTLASGARVYQRIDEEALAQYGERTALGYLAAKLRANDAAGSVRLGKIGESEALILTQELDGAAYQTYIYCYDGSLRELLCPAGETREAAEGERILALDTLSFTLKDALLTARCSLSGRAARVSICVTSTEASA